MAGRLFIRVVDGEVESVGALPVRARRLDTGEWVDPRDRLAACGYFDVEAVTLADLPVGLTPQQRQAIISAVQDARDRLEARRFWLEDTATAWALVKNKGPDYLDIPWSPPSTDPPPTGANSLALHGQQISYLFNRVQELCRWIVGGGTVTTPGLGDVLKVTVEVVAELVEQADEVEPPA